MPGKRKQIAGYAVATILLLLWFVAAVVFQFRSIQPEGRTKGMSGPPVAEDTSGPGEMLEPFRPIEVAAEGYASSRECRECHPKQHAGWYASYHRTMTQLASPSSVMGDFADARVSAFGRRYRLYREGGLYWAAMDASGAPAGSDPSDKQPIVMTTGSHHMQVYWYPTGNSRQLAQLPIVYVKEMRRWIARNAAFLLVPDHAVNAEAGRWNDTCCLCHTTGPRPRPDGMGGWDSVATEFGIACEACHGPGAGHVRLRRGLASGDAGNLRDEIVNPARLSHRRSAEICGQCHSINRFRDFEGSFAHGDSYRPGKLLEESRILIQDDADSRKYYEPRVDDIDAFMRTLFWPDGMVRVSGREFTGLIRSACYQQGEITCLSCHSLHQSGDDERSAAEWANDQLASGMDGDQACLQCHDSKRYEEHHTHHPSGSSGARCYNCHMPHTTYGLLKAMRSHQISIPDVSRDAAAGRPNACNLCHLDKTLAWTSQHLQDWYGAAPSNLDEDQRTVTASLLWLLRGDAGERALAAWSMGWNAALEASGSSWAAPFLACLLEDPYDAVRYIAFRSLRAQRGFSTFAYDFMGAATELAAARERAAKTWSEQPSSRDRSDHELLMDSQTGLRWDLVQRLLDQRNDRPVNLSE